MWLNLVLNFIFFSNLVSLNFEISIEYTVKSLYDNIN